MLIEVVQGTGIKIFGNYRVGVEEMYNGSLRYRKALVVGFGKAGILCISDQDHRFKFLPDHSAAIVARLVIDYNDLRIYSSGSTGHRIEAQFKEGLHIVADNNNGNFLL